jgi:hypothetical protein
LLGEQELGLQAIERCAGLLADPNLDVSWRLERKALETDPELAALRKDPRFAAAMAKAFAKPADEKAPSEPKADGGGRDR